MKTFTANQFIATQWDSAEQKAKFANQFVRFVESDFKQTLFPKWFYTRLSMTFGHIAHYNQAGFYDTFFSSTKRKVSFLEITNGVTGLYGEGGMGIVGDPTFTYSDVEKALRNWSRKTGNLAKYRQQLNEENDAVERGEYERLKQKFGS